MSRPAGGARWLAAAVLLLVPRGAGAEDRTLVRGDVDGAGLRGVLAAVRRCGGAPPGVTAPARPAPPAADPGVLEMMGRARLYTLDAEFERAIDQLQQLYLELGRAPERAGTGQVWAEALTIDAFARWSKAGGTEAMPRDAAMRLDEAVALWPHVEVDRNVVPPPVERALDEARQRRAARPAGEIAIREGRVATWSWVSGEAESTRIVLRPAGRTIVALVDAWGAVRAQLVDVRPSRRVEVGFSIGTRPSSARPPPGFRDPIVVGLAPDGVVAQQWAAGHARVAVTASAESLVARLGLCGGQGAVGGTADEDAGRQSGGERARGSADGVGPWPWIVGAAALVAGGVITAVLLAPEPEAQMSFRLGPDD